jgi:hypothetical protein
MTTPRNPDRLIRTYLQEDQANEYHEVPDHLYNAIRDGIEQTHQRAVIGSVGVPNMNRFLAAGLGLAAVVLAGYLGVQLLGGAAPGGPAPIETPAPSNPPGGEPFVLSFAAGGGPAITLTIPGPGWSGTPQSGLIFKDENSGLPDGAAIIGPFHGDLYVYGDPCQWSTTVPATPATTVAETVVALTAQASRDASASADITADGYTGKSITVHVPGDIAFASDEFTGCDEGLFASWAGGGEPVSAGPSRHHQGPGQIDEVWILDMNGELVVVDAMYGPETPAKDLDELHAILESMTFEPGENP